MTYEAMQEKLKTRLKATRFAHSMGVADAAFFLAKRFNVDTNKARIAGLLHDCARQYPNDQLIFEARKRNITFGAVEESMPLLLHGYIGAQLIKEEYDVDDETDVLIQILSFGSYIEVTAPDRMREELRKRMERQMALVDEFATFFP